MKIVILLLLMSVTLGGCTVGGGFAASNGGMGVGVGTGIRF